MSEEYTPQLLTSEDVFTVQFPATKFRDGYDQNQIDDYLDEVVRVLSYYEALNVAPEAEVDLTYITVRGVDVREVDFDYTRMRVGYDQDAVDDYLDQVAATLEAYENAYGIPPSDQRYQVLEVDGPALEAEAAQQAAAAGELPDGGVPETGGLNVASGASPFAAVSLGASPTGAVPLNAPELGDNNSGYSSILGTPPGIHPGTSPETTGEFPVNLSGAGSETPADSAVLSTEQSEVFPLPDQGGRGENSAEGATADYSLSSATDPEYEAEYADEGEYADYSGEGSAPPEEEYAAFHPVSLAENAADFDGTDAMPAAETIVAPDETQAAPELEELDIDLPSEIDLTETPEMGDSNFSESPESALAPHELGFESSTASTASLGASQTSTTNPEVNQVNPASEFPAETTSQPGAPAYGAYPEPAFDPYGNQNAWGQDAMAPGYPTAPTEGTVGEYPAPPYDPNYAYGYAQAGMPAAGNYPSYPEQTGFYEPGSENYTTENYAANWPQQPQTGMEAGMSAGQNLADGSTEEYVNPAESEFGYVQPGYAESGYGDPGYGADSAGVAPDLTGQYPGTTPEPDSAAAEYPAQTEPYQSFSPSASGWDYSGSPVAEPASAGMPDFTEEVAAEYDAVNVGMTPPADMYPRPSDAATAANQGAEFGGFVAPEVPGYAPQPEEPLTDVVIPDLPTPGVGIDLSGKGTAIPESGLLRGESPAVAEMAPQEPPATTSETRLTGTAAAIEALNQASQEPGIGTASLTNSVAAANQVASTATPDHNREVPAAGSTVPPMRDFDVPAAETPASPADSTAAASGIAEGAAPTPERLQTPRPTLATTPSLAATTATATSPAAESARPEAGLTAETHGEDVASSPGLEALNPAELLTPAAGIVSPTPGLTFTEVPIDHEAATRLALEGEDTLAAETTPSEEAPHELATEASAADGETEVTPAAAADTPAAAKPQGSELPENANPRPLLQGEEPFGEVTEEGRFVPHFLAGYRSNLDTFTSAYGSLEERLQPRTKKAESIAKLEAEQPRKSITTAYLVTVTTSRPLGSDDSVFVRFPDGRELPVTSAYSDFNGVHLNIPRQ